MRNTFRLPRRAAVAFSCIWLLAFVGRNATARAAETPRKTGMRQAVVDADAALRAGDFRIIYISGGTVPDYPLLNAYGGFSIRELYETVVDGCGYRLPGTFVDYQCVGILPEAGYPCPTDFDLEYIAAYNTAVYNWLKRRPEMIAGFAVKNREAGNYPEFPLQPDHVLDMPPGFADRLEPLEPKTEERKADAYRHWLVFEDDTGLCMADLPAGWTLEGNFVQNHDSLSFPGLLWIRLRNPEKIIAVSLLKSVGSRRFGYTPYDRDPKDLCTPESYEPFHDLRFMSAWQFLGIYVAPLLKAVYPGCVAGELEGEARERGAGKCLPSAGFSATRRLEDGGRMTIRIWLDLWDRGGCPQPTNAEAGDSHGRKERYWGIERLLVVSAPEAAEFSVDEATALLGRVLFSPEALAALALEPERVFADSGRLKEEDDYAVAERLKPARHTIPPVRVPLSSTVAAPFSYASPPAGAPAAGSAAAPYSLVNALVEMLMSGDSLYPEYAIREWEKRSRR